MAPAPDTRGRGLALAGLLVGIVGLGLQFAISVPLFVWGGHTVMSAVVRFFSYFTILTNLAAVIVYGSALFARPGAVFNRAGVRTAVAGSIVIVFAVYAAVLSSLWQPQGWLLFCDIVLHYVAPGLYVVWWLIDGRDGTTRYRDVPYWLVYPAAYLIYVMLRAPIAGEVPYPFLDVERNGSASVAAAAAAIFALFVTVWIVLVTLDRVLGSRRPS
ncbi:MAG: Pr6Pr family membrane protein [Rhizobiaceae bacterium]|nr:Pr6Pr family membrane protein [Rhizobiaceae bacterium]